MGVMYRYPFGPYPTGWYRVAWAKDLPQGKALPLRYFGRDLVAFRTESGAVSVLDAHCPHNGAHLGVGGRVVGEALRCPFHAWEFGVGGRCTRVPGRERPPTVGVGCWTVREVNGAVMVWFDTEQRPPAWEMPSRSEYGSPGWTPLHPVGTWRIRIHAQDLMENAIDASHFVHVHSHVARESLSQGLEADGPSLVHRMHVRYSILDAFKFLPGIEGPLVTRLDGLGSMMSRATFGSIRPVSVISGYFVTPLDEEHVEVSAVAAVDRVLPGPLTRLLLQRSIRESRRAMDQDIPIFENKVYRDRPLVQPLDGPIPRYREWVRQFYPAERSARHLDVVE